MTERNELIDPPQSVAEPQIDQRLVAAWLASLRPDERPWWSDVDLGDRPDDSESAFTQALKISISTRRA